MADTEEVSSTTPSEQPKVEASPATGDVTPEAVAKVSENGELPKEVPQEAPAAVADVPAPPETAPPEPVTSTTEDATEAVTVEATAPAHTEEPVTEEKPVVVPEPEPVVVPEPVPEPVVVPEPAPVVVPEPVPEPVVVPEPEPVVVPEPAPEPVVVPEPVPEPVVEAPVPEPAPEPPVVVEEPPVVAAPPPEPVVVSEPVTVPEEPPKVEEPVVVEPPKVEEPAPAPEPKVEKPEPACEPAPAAPAPPLLMQYSAVVDLLYWRDVKTSGVVFGAFMLLLLSLTVCSIITVLSYVALALLSVTVTFRIYKGVMQAIQKSDEGHPFKAYLEKDMALSEELVNKYSDSALGKLNGVIIELRRLFLVEDLVDSLKFAVFMWILTYVGALFNGLTLLILGLIAAFSCPIVYEKHQTQIDQQLAMINNQIKDVVGKVQAKVPGLKKKAE